MKICIIKVDFHKIAFIKLNEKSILWAPGYNRCLSKTHRRLKSPLLQSFCQLFYSV